MKNAAFRRRIDEAIKNDMAAPLVRQLNEAENTARDHKIVLAIAFIGGTMAIAYFAHSSSWLSVLLEAPLTAFMYRWYLNYMKPLMKKKSELSEKLMLEFPRIAARRMNGGDA